MCKKKKEKRKKNGAENCWATAQLCHNTVGNCIVTQLVLGVQWVQSVLQHGVAWVRCIAIEGSVS